MTTDAGPDATTGRFIAFEGGEAAGKSTQCRRLADRLGATATREPGGTPMGEAVRSLCLHAPEVDLHARAEALLMAADRAQHVEQVIRPCLESGVHVVSDRYLYSSVAYQGHGRGLSPTEVRALSDWAVGGVLPDLVVFLDVPVAVARARVADAAPDRMESESDAFHERVRAGFLAQVADEPDRWVVVDGRHEADVVADAVWAAVIERLPDLGSR